MNPLAVAATIGGALWLRQRRRRNPATRTKQRGLFDTRPAQLGLFRGGEGQRADTGKDKAKRLAALEHQRAALRARGYATGDLDAQITRLRASLHESWRNPNFYTDDEGIIHPIRGDLGRAYDRAVDQRAGARAKRGHAAARSGGLYAPGLPQSSGQIRTLRARATRALEHAAQLDAERQETPRGSFEAKYGIAKPPRSVLPRWRARFRKEGYDGRVKSSLSNRDVLLLWTAYQREHPDAHPEDDWYRDLHADTYRAAMTGQVHAKEWRAPAKREVRALTREAKADLQRANKLARVFRAKQVKRVPAAQRVSREIDRLVAQQTKALERGDEQRAIEIIEQIERLETQLKRRAAA